MAEKKNNANIGFENDKDEIHKNIGTIGFGVK